MNDKYLNKNMVAGYLDLNPEAVPTNNNNTEQEQSASTIINKNQQQSTMPTEEL